MTTQWQVTQTAGIVVLNFCRRKLFVVSKAGVEMKSFLESTAGIGLGIFFMVGQFPFGTILMALMCNTRRLDGWDWVLSVVVPFYGIGKVLISNAC